MAAPSDATTDARRQLVDILHIEADAVAVAVARAQTTVRSIIDDARTLLAQPDVDERAWAEMAVRLVQHRATLMDAVATLCQSDGANELVRAPVTAVSIPIPPRPIPHALTVDDRAVDSDSAAAMAWPSELPRPPRPRHR